MKSCSCSPCSLTSALSAASAIFTVTNANDSGVWSLRAAINNANSSPGSTVNSISQARSRHYAIVTSAADNGRDYTPLSFAFVTVKMAEAAESALRQEQGEQEQDFHQMDGAFMGCFPVWVGYSDNLGLFSRLRFIFSR